MALWLQDHADLIGALASVGMLGIWLLYLHLFYRSFRDHQRPMLIIHEGGEATIDAVVAVANMSDPPVHVAVVLVDLVTDGAMITFQPPPRDDATRPVLTQRHQGPLRQGDHVEIGSLRDLLAYGRRLLDTDAATAGPRPDAAPGGDERMTTASEVAVRVVGFVGSGAGLVGTRRRFVIDGTAGSERVRPATPLPGLRAGRRSHREVREWLEASYDLPRRARLDDGSERHRRRNDHAQ